MKESPACKENPCFLLEDGGIKFKPTLLIGVYPSLNNTDYTNGADNLVKFNLESEIVCTFRGLRKAKVL